MKVCVSFPAFHEKIKWKPSLKYFGDAQSISVSLNSMQIIHAFCMPLGFYKVYSINYWDTFLEVLFDLFSDVYLVVERIQESLQNKSYVWLD